MADAVLVIKILTDAAQAQKGMAATSTKVGRVQAGLGKLAAPAAGAALAIAAFGKSAVEAASRTEQAIGAVDSVFGKNAGQVKKWAGSAATDVGLAKSEYMELASVMGAQLKNMGIPLDQVASKTNDLVGLGADLAATYGGTTKEAVEALGSALRGETDPIERYGVSVKQADIAAQQAVDGTDKLTGAAGKQAKTMALLELVNKQTADSQGQFARESDSAAGSAQIAAAKFENMQSALGTALLPAVTMVTNMLGSLSGAMERNKTLTQVIIGVIFALSAAILVAVAALKVYTVVTKLVGIVSKATWLANPIFLVVAALILVGVALVVAYKKSATFRKIVNGLWAGIKSGARAAANLVKAVFGAVWRFLSAAARGFGNAARAVWRAISAVGRSVAGAIRGTWNSLWGALKSGSRGAMAVVKSAITAIKGAVSSTVTSIKNLFSGMWSTIKAGARGVGSILSAPFETAKNAVQSLINLVESLLSKIRSIKMPKLSMPKIPGLGKSTAAVAPGVPVGRYAAPTGRSGRMATTTAVPAAGTTIVIQGALDPEAVARQVRRLLVRHDVRMGGAPA